MIARLGLWWPLLVVLVASVRLDDDVIDNPEEQEPPPDARDAKKEAADVAGLQAVKAKIAELRKSWHKTHITPVLVAKKAYIAGLDAGGSAATMLMAAVESAKEMAVQRGLKPLETATWIMEACKICGAGPLRVAEVSAPMIMELAKSKKEGIRTATKAIIFVQGKGDIPAKIVAKSVSIILLAAGATNEQAAIAAGHAARDIALSNGYNIAEVADSVAKACLDNYATPQTAAWEAGVAAANTAVEHGTDRDTAVYFAGNAAEKVAGPGPHVDRAIKQAKSIIYNASIEKELEKKEEEDDKDYA